NRSSHVSATRAEHVLADLEGRIELILDGGQTPGGLESTVLDITVDPPRVLRPGLVKPSAIADTIGRWPQVSERATEEPATAGRGVLRSPGLMSRHYAPRARLVLTSGDGAAAALDYAARGRTVALVGLGDRPSTRGVITVGLLADAAAYAAALYATLRDLDARGVEIIVAEMPPADEAWLAVRDRLRRAAAAETGGART
ncbi:MAG: hypothetical protein FJX78_01165, partial [Armatimonadetes bacterium]|nr:hypothetical protein [Armatimonadota bacterium]